MIRTWQGGDATGNQARMRIESIARGTEVEVRGGQAADLEARIEAAFGRDQAADDEAGGGEAGEGPEFDGAEGAPATVTGPAPGGGTGWTA